MTDDLERLMRRIDLIDAELKAFIADFEMRHVRTKGSA